MVGERVPRSYSLEDILNEKEVHGIIKRYINEDIPWVFEGAEVKPAMEGLAGFLGDHIRATLCVTVREELKKIHLFIKHIPMTNIPKAKFIDEFNYFRREVFVYKLLEEIAPKDDSNSWCSKAYIYNDCKIVMPDLAMNGYMPRNVLETLDLPHLLLTLTSLARFHAAFTNYETKKAISARRPYSTNQENAELLSDPIYCDSPWLKACAKLTVNFLAAFSKKISHNIPDLEAKLAKLYLECCENFKEESDTLNVLIHKDLWINNIMFKYNNNTPVNAMLVDYQCIRYGPPAFDAMICLYLTTTRKFREQHEREVLLHYYNNFVDNLDVLSKQRLHEIPYNEREFLLWCERSRMFAAFEALAIFPFTLMEPKTAEKTFDDPETYEKYINEDRSDPVVAHAKRCNVYRERQLEVSEEFVERYVLRAK